tara:strand:+ start:1801 stop:4128 length:2328 start_codon:yes stop_codon:yes gene_type:complete
MNLIRFSFFLSIFLFNLGGLNAQKVKVSIVSEHEELIVSAIIKYQNKIYYSDFKGELKLDFHPGDSIFISAFSFRDSLFILPNEYPGEIRISLKYRSVVLNTIDVISKKVDNINLAMEENIYNIKVRAKDIKQFPQIGGEPDVIRPIILNPGVQNASPGSVGIYVRGSDQYQTGIFLDAVPIYNTNHAMGFASPFTSYSLKSLNFHKESIPLKYGNSPSAVLDLQMRAASMKKFKGELAMGFGSLRTGFDIPLKKINSSLLIASRISTFSLAQSTLNLLGIEPESQFGFEDHYLKFSNRIGDQSFLESFYYRSGDRFSSKNFLNAFSAGQNISYESINKFSASSDVIGITLKNKKGKFYGNTHVYYSNFNQKFSNEYSDYEQIKLILPNLEPSLIQRDFHNLGFKSNFQIQLNQSFFSEFGIELNSFFDRFRENDSEIDVFSLPLNILGIFAEAKYSLAKNLEILGGVRISNTNNSKNGEGLYLDYNLRANYFIDNRFSLYSSYEQRHGFVHRFRQNNFGSATDFPILSSQNLVPSSINQFSIGVLYFQSNWNFSLGFFNKKLNNAVDRDYNYPVFLYSESEQLTQPDMANGLLSVDGNSHGIESSLKINKEIYRGSIAYTWSQSFRNSPEIDDGQTYPFEFAREHVLSLSSFIRFKRNSIQKITEIGVTYFLGSGNFTQFPLQRANTAIPEVEDLPFISQRNNVQLPFAQSLDLQFNFIAKKKRGTRIFTISVINVTMNKNINSLQYSFRQNGNSIKANGGWPIIPSFSYAYQF